eukprot:9497442-Pyramimonas_sp.AAC.2
MSAETIAWPAAAPSLAPAGGNPSAPCARWSSRSPGPPTTRRRRNLRTSGLLRTSTWQYRAVSTPMMYARTPPLGCPSCCAACGPTWSGADAAYLSPRRRRAPHRAQATRSQ